MVFTRQWSIPLVLAATVLVAWLVLGSAPGTGPKALTVEPPGADTSHGETGLAVPPAAEVMPVTYELPPAPRPDARRLRLVSVGPPGQSEPETSFEVWSFSRSDIGERLRIAPAPHRTAPNEAWFAFPLDASLVWIRASADRGRLVSTDGRYVELLHAGPDPQVARVPVFAVGDLKIRVVDAEGHAIAGAQVADAYDSLLGVPTDGEGVSRMRGIVGDVYLHASAQGHAPSAREHFVVPPGGQVERTLVCGASRIVTGRALDERGLALSGRISAAGQTVPIGADGSFRFESLPIASEPKDSLELRTYDEHGTASASVVPPSPAGTTSDLGIVRLVSRRRVPIRFTSPKGEPLLGVTFAVVPQGGSTDTQRFVIVDPTTADLEDGTYRIEARPFSVRAPATLVVNGAWSAPPATFVLEDAFVVRGRCVHHREGSPNWLMLMLRARAERKADDSVKGIDFWARLDAEGRFVATLPEAMRGAKLEIEAPYATLVSGLSAPKDDSEWVVDLPAEQTFTLVVRAVDESDRPLPFRMARFERIPSRAPLVDGWFGSSSADGEASFWPVPKGSYRAFVERWDGTEKSSDAATIEQDRQVFLVRFER